jgi:hypothetical protein
MLRMSSRRMRSVRPRMEPILALEDSFCQKVWEAGCCVTGTMELGEVVRGVGVGLVVGAEFRVEERTRVVWWEDIEEYFDAEDDDVGSGAGLGVWELVLVGGWDIEDGGSPFEASIAVHFDAWGGPGSMIFEMPNLCLTSVTRSAQNLFSVPCHLHLLITMFTFATNTIHQCHSVA